MWMDRRLPGEEMWPGCTMGRSVTIWAIQLGTRGSCQSCGCYTYHLPKHCCGTIAPLHGNSIPIRPCSHWKSIFFCPIRIDLKMDFVKGEQQKKKHVKSNVFQDGSEPHTELGCNKLIKSLIARKQQWENDGRASRSDWGN